MYDQLKEDVQSWQADQAEVNRERNHGLDDGKYHWCPNGCKEQVANCRCEAIRVSNERIAAYGRFENMLWHSKGVAAARAEVEAMGFSQGEIEDTIKWVAYAKLLEESDKRTRWFQDG